MIAKLRFDHGCESTSVDSEPPYSLREETERFSSRHKKPLIGKWQDFSVHVYVPHRRKGKGFDPGTKFRLISADFGHTG